MFSEYASRFLAQSQTRMSAIRDPRLNREAPLFFSVADNLPEDHEHDQEVQDFYALKSSRRHFGAYADSNVGQQVDEDEEIDSSRGTGLGASSESIPDPRQNRARVPPVVIQAAGGHKWGQRSNLSSSSHSSTSTVQSPMRDKGKEKSRRLDSVNLEDSVRLGMNPDQIDHSDMVSDSGMLSPELERAGPSRHGGRSQLQSIMLDMPESESPPPSQYFQRPPTKSTIHSPQLPPRSHHFMPVETPAHEVLNPLSHSAVPPPVVEPSSDPPIHDSFWRTMYLLSMAAMFATGFLSWVQTDDGSLSKVIDTVHTVIHSHLHLLAVDTVIAVGVSLIWMYLLRRFVKLLMYALLFAVPIVLLSMSIWPLVQSYKGRWGGGAKQDKAMRWASIVPAVMSAMWVLMAYRSRNAMGRAMAIIQLACKILSENPALILLSFGTLFGTLVFTWMWVGMFQSVFLYGKVGVVRGVPVFYLDWTTWFMGSWFIIMYLWTIGVLSGFQRATSAATVSQWYYYRHAIPSVPSKDVMDAAMLHSASILSGTICFSSFAALMVRLPILVLPRRLVGIIHLLAFNFIASPISAITHPLTLTYAAIHSLPLVPASRAVATMRFVDLSSFSGQTYHPRAGYRLAKMLLSGTRAVMALSLGVGAWIGTARSGNGEGVVGGSLYGYIVGLIAGAIGWAVLGATEGCLSNVVDAVLVCVGSEGAEGGHCREAMVAFGA